jgi:hypothetical protein
LARKDRPFPRCRSRRSRSLRTNVPSAAVFEGKRL